MLARRCLQAMIRDFFDVCCDTLFEETDEIRGHIDQGTWSLIDDVRKIGGMQAHTRRTPWNSQPLKVAWCR